MEKYLIPIIREKYEDRVELDEKNIKDIYFLSYCNSMIVSEYIENYLKRNYSNNIILKWNDEYVNILLDEICILLKNDGMETIKKITNLLKRSITIFSKEKSTYKRIIDIIVMFYNKFGYFMNYFIKDKLKPDDIVFGYFIGIYINLYHSEMSYKQSSGRIYHYIDNIDYDGLIPNLYYLGYVDLLKEAVNKLIKPIYANFEECSKYMSDNNLVYDNQSLESSLDNYSLKLLLDNFFTKYKIEL